MAEDTRWQLELSFSERYSRVLELTSLYQKEYAAQDLRIAQQQAKIKEEDAYASSKSLSQYLQKCRVILHDKNSQPSGDDQETHLEEIFKQTDKVVNSQESHTIGSYKDARLLTTTLSSTIYRALGSQENNPNAFVALKVTYPGREPPPHNSQREVEILRDLSCPAIIPLLKADRVPGGALVMAFPYIPTTLSQMLGAGLEQNKNYFNHDYAKVLLSSLFSALAYLHNLGIIHRDVKPSNLLLSSKTGPLLLIDFGTAWAPGPSQRDLSAVEPDDEKITDVGTTSYRPPELLFGNQTYGTTLDLWAAGCVAYEILAAPSKSLFDSGELGSEFALIFSVFKTLGTPDDATWPEAEKFPDWGKMQFTRFQGESWAELMPKASEEEREFVSRLLRFESGERMTAQEALCHSFLT